MKENFGNGKYEVELNKGLIIIRQGIETLKAFDVNPNESIARFKETIKTLRKKYGE